MVRKGLIAAAVVLLILAGGGYAGVQYVKSIIADRVMDEVVEQVLRDEEVRRLLDDPEVRQSLREAASGADLERLRGEIRGKLGSGGSEDASVGGSGVGTLAADGGALPVASLEEAEALVLEKFSLDEIRRFAAYARGGLTEEEKQQIREEVMGRFTEEEWQALLLVALVEAEKRSGE